MADDSLWLLSLRTDLSSFLSLVAEQPASCDLFLSGMKSASLYVTAVKARCAEIFADGMGSDGTVGRHHNLNRATFFSAASWLVFSAAQLTR
jgi:hypothetical protein